MNPDPHIIQTSVAATNMLFDVGADHVRENKHIARRARSYRDRGSVGAGHAREFKHNARRARSN